MSLAAPPLAPLTETEQRIVLPRIGWDVYAAIVQQVGEGRSPRLVYLDKDLILTTKSRRHEWFAERLGELVWAVAAGSGVECEDAAEATFRRADLEAGVMGDKTYYLGAHAERLRGPHKVDLALDPPPDLAIEVEIAHPPTEALEVYCRLRVPEVWHVIGRDPLTVQILVLGPEGTYTAELRSLCLPRLCAEDVRGKLEQAVALGASRWFKQLPAWVAALLERDAPDT